MSDIVITINIIVLLIAIVFAIYRVKFHGNVNSKKSHTNNLHEEHNVHHKHYDGDEWRYHMPDTAIKLLEECFQGDTHKVYHAKRAIELSIEHFVQKLDNKLSK